MFSSVDRMVVDGVVVDGMVVPVGRSRLEKGGRRSSPAAPRRGASSRAGNFPRRTPTLGGADDPPLPEISRGFGATLAHPPTAGPAPDQPAAFPANVRG